MIAQSFEQSRNTYGSPRVRLDLRELGQRCGKNRVGKATSPTSRPQEGWLYLAFTLDACSRPASPTTVGKTRSVS